MTALIALPIAAFVLLSALARRVLRHGGLPDDWPAGLVVGALLLCGFVVGVTEGLSLVGLLSFWPALLAWLCLIVALGMALMFRDRGLPATHNESILPRCSQWRTVGFWLWVSAAIVLAVTLFIALAAPVNTHDATGYHLPRQVRWMQMWQVRHYATDDMRELSFAPLAEFAQMHTMLLTGGDVFVNMPQWLSYALAALGAGLMCRALGYARAAPFGAFVVVSQPVAYLQAASPKNDPVLGFLVVAFSWLSVEAIVSRKCGVIHACLLGLALGLAALTKSTAIVILFPVCVLVATVMLWQHRAGAVWRGIIIALFAAIVNVGHVGRNVAAFDHPLGPLTREAGGFALAMERHDAGAVGSNVLRNLALHAPIGSLEHAAIVERRVRSWHDRLGWDPDDPQTTWLSRYAVEVNVTNEGRAPAPVHVLVIVLSIGPLCAMCVRKRTGSWMPLAMWLCGVLGFWLFAATVKWNPWHVRLHAPIIAMLAGPVAVAIWPSRGRVLGSITVALSSIGMALMLAWMALINIDRPLLGPKGVLFHPRQESTLWRWPDEKREVLGAVEGIDNAPPGPVAVLANDDDYLVMRSILDVDPTRVFTHIYSKLGRTGVEDPQWRQPVAVISAYHVRPVVMLNQQFFVRRNVAASLNQFSVVESPPARAVGDSIPYIHRYHGLEDPTKPQVAGRMAQYHAGHRTVYGLILTVKGTAIPVPGDGQPHVLLLSLNPQIREDVRVRVTLDNQVLLESELLPVAHYTSFEVLVPAGDNPASLRIEFPELEGPSGADAAAVGWLQLPTAAQVKAYDRRTRADEPVSQTHRGSP